MSDIHMVSSTQNIQKNKKDILIIEDDTFLSRALTDTFQREGYQVHARTDGEGVMEYIRTHDTIALVLLDLMIPLKSGFEVLEEIKNDAVTASLPVIIISNLSQPHDIEKAKALGALDFIVKSDISLKEIVSRAKQRLLS
jgi:two-component system chemotaxis response regulator CheV